MNTEESTKRYKEFIRLKAKGLSYRDIATMYGISAQAVYNRVKKGTPKSGSPMGLLGLEGLSNLEGRDRARALVRLRDKYTCQDCGLVRAITDVRNYNSRIEGLKGRIKSLDVHHTHGQCGKNTRGFDKAGDISKMVTLCHSCHFNRPEHRSQSNEFARNVSIAKTKK